jgi:hypothetical protein
MSVHDDAAPLEDDLDGPDWDDQSPEQDPDLAYEDHLAREAEHAYAALPWWRRLRFDWQTSRSERRYWRHFRKVQRDHARALRRGEDLPILPDNEAPF